MSGRAGGAFDQPAADAAVPRMGRVGTTVLSVGVTVSLVAIVAGLVIGFVAEPGSTSSTGALDRLIDGEADFPQTLGAVVRGMAEGSGSAVVVAGLLLLIVTPVLRVATLLVLFALQRDRAFTAITAVVLAVVLVSFAVGRAGG